MLISCAYAARVGKDTIADYLVKEYDFIKLSWAYTLKQACREIFGLTDEQMYGNLKEVIDPYWGVTPRIILQKVGTDCLREWYDEDIWVKSLYKKMEKGKNYCIPDTRFINEVYAVRKWGGKVIKVVRNDVTKISGIFGHSSETSLDNYTNWDYIIENNGTFEDLYRKVDSLMKMLKET